MSILITRQSKRFYDETPDGLKTGAKFLTNDSNRNNYRIDHLSNHSIFWTFILPTAAKQNEKGQYTKQT